MEKKASFWKAALIYGAIAGFVGILLGVIFYLMNLYAASWTQWVSILVAIAVLVYCLKAYRNEYLGGYARFGQLFLMALVIGVIASIISLIYSYLMYTVIDHELLDKIRLAAEEKMMNNPRIPESMLDEMIERLEKNFEPRRMYMMTVIGGTAMYAILGLILAAILKKEETPLDTAV